jgi:hypothetical protein
MLVRASSINLPIPDPFFGVFSITNFLTRPVQVIFNISLYTGVERITLNWHDSSSPAFFKTRWAAPRAASGGAAIGVTAAVGTAVAAPLSIPTIIATSSAAMYGTVAATDAVNKRLKIPEPRLLGTRRYLSPAGGRYR